MRYDDTSFVRHLKRRRRPPLRTGIDEHTSETYELYRIIELERRAHAARACIKTVHMRAL